MCAPLCDFWPPCCEILATGLSEGLIHLIKCSTSPEKKLDNLHVDLLELFKYPKAENGMVACLLEQCPLIVRKSKVTCLDDSI